MNHSVTFSIHCHAGDKVKLYTNLIKIVLSHNHHSDKVQIILQKTPKPPLYKKYNYIFYTDLNTELFKSYCIKDDNQVNNILLEANIPINDQKADEITHGPASPHYWKNHVVNHLYGATCTDSEYIVFSDADCIMIKNESPGWISTAINYLENHPNCLAVSPSDGSPGKQWIMSQQIFIINRKRFLDIDFNCWNGKFINGGPMQEFYAMLEGRMSMYMLKHYLYRLVLPDDWRYYHDWEHHKEPKYLYNMAMEKLK